MRRLDNIRPEAATKLSIDAALASGELRVVPGVRGCIWLVPRQDHSLCLRVSAEQARKRTLRELDQLGVPEADLQDLGQQVLQALEGGPLSPKELREVLPEGAVSSLGAAGKKKGHNTTLPAAIRLLEWEGRVARYQEVLDTERYLWGLPRDAPLELGVSPTEVEEQARELALRFFSWAGPASIAEFVTWSGLGKRVARKAVQGLDLVEVQVEDLDEPRWAFEAALDRREPTGWALLPAQDNLISLRASPAMLAELAFHEVELQAMGRSRTVPLREARWMFHRCVTRDGELVGLWDWDEDSGELLVGGFGEALSPSAPGLAELCQDLSVLKANAIDGQRSRRKRWARVRELA